MSIAACATPPNSRQLYERIRPSVVEVITQNRTNLGVSSMASGFVTIASQRPADISPTIVSQLHNFFIHRLVNDRDLFLVDNTISTLDSLSRSLIPGLSQGCCVVTGTAFELPMVIQVDRLPNDKQPASEDVDLEVLWSEPPGEQAPG